MFQHEILKSPNHYGIQYVLHHPEIKKYKPKHWHEEIEIIYVNEGELRNFYLEGELFNLKAGEYLVVNSGAIHSVPIQNNNDVATMSLFLGNTFLEKYLPEGYRKFLFHLPLQLNQAYSVAKNIQRDLSEFYQTAQIEPNNILHLKRLLMAITDDLLTYFSQDSHALLPQVAVQTDEKLYQVIFHMKKYAHTNMSVAELAQKMGWSSSYLTRFTKSKLGMTPFEYLQKVKLNRAVQLLMNTDKSLPYIADVTGFSSAQSMTRAFNHHYQLSPKAYRRQVQKIN